MPERLCDLCGKSYYRRNLTEVWDEQTPGSRTGWHKTRGPYLRAMHERDAGPTAPDGGSCPHRGGTEAPTAGVMNASMTFEDWTHLHLRASLTTKRYFGSEALQPMLVIRTSADQDVVGILAVPKSQVQATIQAAVAAHPGARAIALVLDTWVGEPRSTPIPRGVRVRDLPGTMDAMVAIGMLPDGTTGGWMARYLLIDGEVIFEPETPVAEDMPVVSKLLPAPWGGVDHV